jgi:hypothetical protein
LNIVLRGHPFGVSPALSAGNEYCELDAFEDTLTVEHAIALLKQAAGKQFYLGVGLHKPHMPWQASYHPHMPCEIVVYQIEIVSAPAAWHANLACKYQPYWCQ